MSTAEGCAYRRFRSIMENSFNLGTWEEFVTKSFKQLGYGDFQQVFSAGKSLDIGCGSRHLTGGLQAIGIRCIWYRS